MVALVKPMFELHLSRLPDDQEAALASALDFAVRGAEAAGWILVGTARSPVLGRGGAVDGIVHARQSI